jgi:hypothetical protein
MSKRSVLLGIGIASVLLVGAASSQAATATSTTSSSENIQTFTLVGRTDQGADIDVGKKGPSLGDSFAFSDNILQNGKKIGTDGGTCTIVNLGSKLVRTQCLVTVSLPKGDLTVQGIAVFPLANVPNKPSTLAITGGTRAYRTAQGEVTVTDLPNGDTQIVVRIVHHD